MILKSILSSALVQKTKVVVEQLRYCSPDVFRSRAHVGNEVIAAVIRDRTPAAIGKLGSTELQTLRGYLRYRNSADCDPRTAHYRRILLEFSGVYPDDYETFRRWGDYWAGEVLPAMTHIGAWFNLNESWIVRRYAKNARVFHSYGLEPYIFPNPWSAELAGKKVVVVSPFSASIRQQYPRRADIWARQPDVLPEFELHTVQCPTYPHLAKPEFPDWFASLEDMKRRIEATGFDVLLVGAGAYSLPLCVHAKSLGKVGIHLGGNTQLMFGILGKRWLVPNASIDHRFFNDAWIYPLAEDTPENCVKVEGGCYWK
ncbi:MAG: hypothetical protein WC789_00345 [Lentisphaeria bacterium]|jgi:hypothetical protein